MLSPKPPPPIRAATTLMVQRRTILALGREILRAVVSVCVPRWPRRTCGAHRKMKRAARALRGGAAAARPLPEAAALTHKDIRAYTQEPLADRWGVPADRWVFFPASRLEDQLGARRPRVACRRMASRSRAWPLS